MNRTSFSPYSFSKLNVFLTCPRQFKYKYINKLPVEEKDKTALFKGSAIHDILENYPNPGTHKLAEKYQYIVDKFLKSRYKYFLDIPAKKEMGIGLDHELNPVPYSNDALFRGYIDYFTVIDNVMYIVDWKSGRNKDSRYQSYDQLMFYAIYMFKKYSQIDKITIMYIYVEHNRDNNITLTREHLDKYINTLLIYIENLETSVFPKKIQKLCEYCDYKTFCNKDT